MTAWQLTASPSPWLAAGGFVESVVGTIREALEVTNTSETSMGSKRTQQIHKDLLATDFKTRTNDEQIHEEDKQALHHARGKLALPRRGENPALGAVKARKAGRRRRG